MWELANCPFCGHDNSALEISSLTASIGYIRCKECGARGPIGRFQEVVDAWNNLMRGKPSLAGEV